MEYQAIPLLFPRSIYLAGPIEHCTDAEMNDWRTEATYMLNPIKCFNPCKRHFDMSRGNTDTISKQVVALDKAEIAASDGLLVWYKEPKAGSRMTGTTMEIIHAFERGKLVVVVSAYPEVSSWVDYHSHKIFYDLQPACEWIKKFYS